MKIHTLSVDTSSIMEVFATLPLAKRFGALLSHRAHGAKPEWWEENGVHYTNAYPALVNADSLLRIDTFDIDFTPENQQVTILTVVKDGINHIYPFASVTLATQWFENVESSNSDEELTFVWNETPAIATLSFAQSYLSSNDLSDVYIETCHIVGL